jgi:hypothetical protein
MNVPTVGHTRIVIVGATGMVGVYALPIYGTCSYWGYTGCGYCQSPKTFYTAFWDRNRLNPGFGEVCGHLSAGFAGHQTMTYTTGHSTADCTVNFSPNNETTVIDGYTFQYVTARATDGAELLDLNNGASYLRTP